MTRSATRDEPAVQLLAVGVLACGGPQFLVRLDVPVPGDRGYDVLARRFAVDQQLACFWLVQGPALHRHAVRVGRRLEHRLHEVTDLGDVAVVDGLHEAGSVSGEVAAAVCEHRLDSSDRSVDVGGPGLRARGTLLGQDLFVLALLRGVTAILLPHLVALPTVGRVAFALLIAASLPLLTLCRQLMPFARLLKPLLLSLVSLAILP